MENSKEVKQLSGKIIKGIAGFYYVYGDNHRLYECKAKGSFRKNHEKPLVGDLVCFVVLDEEKQLGNIEKILARKNALIRPAVANVDQAMVIFAVEKPKPNYNLLDRFLLMMEQNQIPCMIVFNKCDLMSEEDRQKMAEIYALSGHPLYFMSVKEEIGIKEVRKALMGKTTTVAGPSGVGKSSFINLLQDRVQMETGAISEKIDRGKHTTRHSELITLGEDSYIFDTPGFSSLGIFQLEKEDLKNYYREFENLEGQCKYMGCNHMNEPGCVVKTAVDQGIISKVRYENYKLLFEECSKQKKY